MENNIANSIAQLVPLIILTSMVLAMAIYLIQKKGKNWALLILAFIPLLNSLLIIYLLAQTNKKTKEDIQKIKDHLGIE